MKKCLIIGGGLAGLSSAVFLTQKGYFVELIEASPKLGGRTYSFFDKENHTEIDNGQHILMGSYTNTFEFLKLIGAESIPEYQSKLKVEYLKKGGKSYTLSAPHRFYPFNLIQALLNFKAVTFRERISVLKLLTELVFVKKNQINHTVLEYLTSNKQSQNVIDSVWELITVSALNTKINEASVNMFLFLLKKMFLEGNKSSTIVLPKVPLSKLFIEPTQEFFKKNDIKYSCSEAAVSLSVENERIIKVNTNKREILNFDNIILAIPHHALKKINSRFSIISDGILNLESSSIITIHMWSKYQVIKNNFAGLIGSKIHWVFNNGTHISVVISAADEYTKMKNAEIFEFVLNELNFYLPNFPKESVTDYKVMKEKRATIKCTYNNEILRSKIKTDIKNLVFAGDWTNTKLPGTIEGAIQSGKSASVSILKK